MSDMTASITYKCAMFTVISNGREYDDFFIHVLRTTENCEISMFQKCVCIVFNTSIK